MDPREAIESAAREFDNIRWDDVLARVDANGEDDLARWTKKYLGYVRSDIENALAAFRANPRAVESEARGGAALPPLDVERLRSIVRNLTDEHGWPKSAVGFDAFIEAIAIEYARLSATQESAS